MNLSLSLWMLKNSRKLRFEDQRVTLYFFMPTKVANKSFMILLESTKTLRV